MTNTALPDLSVKLTDTVELSTISVVVGSVNVVVGSSVVVVVEVVVVERGFLAGRGVFRGLAVELAFFA